MPGPKKVGTQVVDKGAVSVEWSIKWPGPVEYSMLTPVVRLSRNVGPTETVEAVTQELHDLALQSTIEHLLDGLAKLKKQ